MMNEKILIVDDQYGIRILLNEVFNKEGYQTFQAANGLQALDIVTKERPDLVLLDMKIPGMDGIEILKRMKVIDENIRVIIMTAYGELDMIQESKELGALTAFAKPFDIDEIRDAVKKYLPLKSNLEHHHHHH
uniref:Sporulation initiation phosphotransferase F n=1 Tax=Bacillus subtilis TaxID=1423 RepID=UPI0001753A1B|nr:Chain A, Sporulation initiation phosphotransferase F [Bacillus subtilis]